MKQKCKGLPLQYDIWTPESDQGSGGKQWRESGVQRELQGHLRERLRIPGREVSEGGVQTAHPRRLGD